MEIGVSGRAGRDRSKHAAIIKGMASGAVGLRGQATGTGAVVGGGRRQVLRAFLILILADKKEITWFGTTSEYGFANIVNYKGNARWHLKPGDYPIQITSRENCVAAMSRGATLTLGEEINHPTEVYLNTLLAHSLATFCLWGGLLGLVVCEWRR